MQANSASTAQSVERFFEFSLLGLLASGYFAVVGSGVLDLPTTLLTAAGLIVRALLIAGVVRVELTHRHVNVATIAYVVFYGIDYLYISREFLPATVHLVFFLAIVKILTARTNRDYFMVKLIAFLELLAATLLSTSANFFVFLALFLLFGVATFCSSEIRASAKKGHRLSRSFRMFHWRLAALTLTVSTGILIMTGGLFFLLPRTARAAFQHLVSQRYHLPGFSNEVTLGQIGEIKRQSTTVMHVRIEDSKAHLPLKWRGSALADFDGRRWSNPLVPGQVLRVGRGGLLPLADTRQRWRPGHRISYEVNVKALDSDALFFAGVPEFVRINVPLVMKSPVGSFTTGVGTSDGLHYFAISHVNDNINDSLDADPLSPQEALLYTRLPAYDGRIAALARELTHNLPTAGSRAKAIEQHLTSNYGYTTELLRQEVEDPLAHFLFDRRKGHCEYFASAMTVMLRTLNIPSRIATGFQSGTYNPMTGWHLIRASDAHSWVEAYLPGRGWTAFDPTPPDPNAALAAAGLMHSLMLYADAIETFWQEWVLNYDLDRQLNLATRVESSGRLMSLNWWDRSRDSLRSIAIGTVAGGKQYGPVVAMSIALGLLSFYCGPPCARWWRVRQRVRRFERGEGSPLDATLLYDRMLGHLRRRGYEKPAWLTPSEFARVLPDSGTAMLVSGITDAYNELRFGGSKEAGSRMLQLIKRLETEAVGR